ncbi:M81 family metallopeptidase [Alcaligenaceae bacterium C4P045]|nr:M81 family metallopeptidase [Alcaligenaceae bacterium C4P045]
MSTKPYRVLVGQIFQETHGFSPVPTPMRAFEVDPASSMIDTQRQSDSTLGGIIRTLEAAGVELIPSIAARARCGGKVTNEAYAEISAAIVAAAEHAQADAIALDLHGCMQTEALDSAELDLLTRLRAVVGPRLPIVAGFDLHAHATADMLSLLDFSSAYKTNPHADAAQTGQRVADHLLHMLRTGERPAGYFLRVPMLTSGNDETGTGPLQAIHQSAQAAIGAHTDLIDYSVFNVNPFIDGPQVGQGVLVYGAADAPPDHAANLANTLAQDLWDARAAFVHTLPTIDDVIARYPRSAQAITIGDFGDRVLAGAPGDSVHILDRVLTRGDRHITIIVADPDAYLRCAEAGVGATLETSLGASLTPGLTPVTVSGRVNHIGDGSFTNRGQFMKGGVLRLGPYAVLAGKHFIAVITQDAVMSQDPGCYLDAGVPLDNADIIVVKSGYHFKLAFQGYGPCVIAETPGLTGFAPDTLPFSQCRPIYPLDRLTPVLEAQRLTRG